MKERAKIYRARSKNKSYELGARLASSNLQHDDKKNDGNYITQRRKLGDGTAQIIDKQGVTPMKEGQKK